EQGFAATLFVGLLVAVYITTAGCIGVHPWFGVTSEALGSCAVVGALD
ncbi:unnamed protein product, partial [Allacma fusca]